MTAALSRYLHGLGKLWIQKLVGGPGFWNPGASLFRSALVTCSRVSGRLYYRERPVSTGHPVPGSMQFRSRAWAPGMRRLQPRMPARGRGPLIVFGTAITLAHLRPPFGEVSPIADLPGLLQTASMSAYSAPRHDPRIASMNPRSSTHSFDATQGSRPAKAFHSQSTETHSRQKCSGRLRTFLTCALVSVTVAVTGCSSSGPQRSGTGSAAPTVDLCADEVPPVPAGPTNGKLVGSINKGRILMAIETAGAGTIALAYIDAGGLHVVPMAHDGTIAHPTWAPDGTIVFDSERAGGRHLFRIATDGSGL